ncbi:putative L-ascorbate-6-phosphate lactonase UlaG [compost metagenome]
MHPIPVRPLGQSGFRFQFSDTVLYTDPYLTNHVGDVEGEALNRLIPSFLVPSEVTDADWVLVSHLHLDHCDPTTLLPLVQASPRCKILCPGEVASYLETLGVETERLVLAREEWLSLGPDLDVHPVPAAHPAIERDEFGLLRYVGYVVRYRDRFIYHAGDTSADQLMIDTVKALGRIDVAILPVNERNFFKERQGIIGNMSIREAFGLAEEIGAKHVLPMHWDMFAPNSVFEEEIRLVYELLNPPFEMILNPQVL